MQIKSLSLLDTSHISAKKKKMKTIFTNEHSISARAKTLHKLIDITIQTTSLATVQSISQLNLNKITSHWEKLNGPDSQETVC